MIICICSSGKFYEHVWQIKLELEKIGHTVLVPATCEEMAKGGDFDIDKRKIWYQDQSKYNIKKQKMDEHFAKIRKSESILIVNDDKLAFKTYIGPNVMMEISLAYFENKPVYILNEPDPDSLGYEEIMGINAIILDGNIGNIK